MNGGIRKQAWWVAGLMAMGGISPVQAELPGLSDTEWIGYFVGFQSKKVQFGLSTKGRATLKIIGAKGVPLSQRMSLAVDFAVEEMRPDGTKYVHFIVPESLESSQPASKELKNVTFHGKVKGDATFEVMMDENKGVISLGGRLLTTGTVKNPLRFAINVKVPDAYPSAKKGGDKKLEKAFAEKTKGDRLVLTMADGKRTKVDLGKPTNVGSKDVYGVAISGAELEFGSYEGKKLEFAAGENSTISIGNPPTGPLNEGFILSWIADPAKDTDGKARLTIEVK